MSDVESVDRKSISKVREQHMKKRCMAIAVMCALSVHGWVSYSPYDLIHNETYTPMYLNCVLFLGYLTWDTFEMLTKRRALFRTDLAIHHALAFVMQLLYLNHAALMLNHMLLMECVSLMNHIWRDRPKRLLAYRVLCIWTIRLPLSLWLWLAYIPNVACPYWQATCSERHSQALCAFRHAQLFFWVYDFHLLRKLSRRSSLDYTICPTGETAPKRGRVADACDGQKMS